MTAVALSTLTGLLLVGCAVRTGPGSASSESISAPPAEASATASLPPGASPYAIPTGTFMPADPSASAMAAELSGTLRLTGGGCLILGGTGSEVGGLVVWPAGYSAVRWADGRVAVLDELGRQVAEMGDPLFVGGGYGRLLVTDHRCLNLGQGFEVNSPVWQGRTPPP